MLSNPKTSQDYYEEIHEFALSVIKEGAINPADGMRRVMFLEEINSDINLSRDGMIKYQSGITQYPTVGFFDLKDCLDNDAAYKNLTSVALSVVLCKRGEAESMLRVWKLANENNLPISLLIVSCYLAARMVRPGLPRCTKSEADAYVKGLLDMPAGVGFVLDPFDIYRLGGQDGVLNKFRNFANVITDKKVHHKPGSSKTVVALNPLSFETARRENTLPKFSVMISWT